LGNYTNDHGIKIRKLINLNLQYAYFENYCGWLQVLLGEN